MLLLALLLGIPGCANVKWAEPVQNRHGGTTFMQVSVPTICVGPNGLVAAVSVKNTYSSPLTIRSTAVWYREAASKGGGTGVELNATHTGKSPIVIAPGKTWKGSVVVRTFVHELEQSQSTDRRVAVYLELLSVNAKNLWAGTAFAKTPPTFRTDHFLILRY